MNANEPLRALAPVVSEFERLGVAYYLGGSLASSLYGVARTTADADLVAALRQEHVRTLVDAFQSDYYVSEPMIQAAIRNESCFNFIHLATMFKIDVFVARTDRFRLSAFGRVRRDHLGETEQVAIQVASPEDVVLAKLRWYRQGGEVSERQWSDVIGVLRVQAHALDWPYLRLWSAHLGVSDLLDQVAADAIQRT